MTLVRGRRKVTYALEENAEVDPVLVGSTVALLLRPLAADAA